MKTKLNVGCGKDIKKDYINIDVVKLPGVDVVHNLNKFPWPFKDDKFDEILCSHVLEHVTDFERTIKEIHRILKKGGIVKITVPHFSGVGAWTCPQHKRAFGYFTFDFFCEETKYDVAKGLGYCYSFKFNKILKKHLIFGKKYQVWNWIIEWIANKFPHFYEDSFLKSFPAIELYIEMQK